MLLPFNFVPDFILYPAIFIIVLFILAMHAIKKSWIKYDGDYANDSGKVIFISTIVISILYTVLKWSGIYDLCDFGVSGGCSWYAYIIIPSIITLFFFSFGIRYYGERNKYCWQNLIFVFFDILFIGLPVLLFIAWFMDNLEIGIL